MYGEGSAETARWVKGRETPLYQGHADCLAEQLRNLATTHRRVAQALRKEAGYFATNQRRMQYLETREDGFPIGSGTVESGIKQFRTRFTGPACGGVAQAQSGYCPCARLSSATVLMRCGPPFTARP